LPNREFPILPYATPKKRAKKDDTVARLGIGGAFIALAISFGLVLDDVSWIYSKLFFLAAIATLWPLPWRTKSVPVLIAAAAMMTCAALFAIL
jgi:uncharacterized membrane protein